MQSVLMMDTGRQAVWRAADWFAAKGDDVTVLTRRQTRHEGVRTLAVDWMDKSALDKAIQEAAKQDRLDMLILGVPRCDADGPIGTGHDTERMEDTLVECARGTLNLIEASLPFLRRGMKRIACITETESSNAWSQGKDNLTYHQCLAGMNMLGKLMFNRLRPEGFTFRWYCDDEGAAPMCAAEYILSQLSYDPREPSVHNDEDRLVMRDGFLREIAW